MSKRLLIMTNWFKPGFKAGGSITACFNLAMLLQSGFDIYILTSDKDLNDKEPYSNITSNTWIDFSDNIRVKYLSNETSNWASIRREINSINPHSIYLNSMFSLYYAIYPVLMKRMGMINARVILSPAGMLKESAVQYKAFKKRCFLFLARLAGFHAAIRFHATDDQEIADIRKYFGSKAEIVQILYAPPPVEPASEPITKKAGELKLIFVGRIHPIKNLHFLNQCLENIAYRISLTVVGPIEDLRYYERCRAQADKLPYNISIHFTGGMQGDNILQLLAQNHFLAFPSLGENFGYVIAEALSVGRPVIISDKTPWRVLPVKKAGWDLSIDNTDEFVAAIKEAAEMTQVEYNEWSAAARQHYVDFLGQSHFFTGYSNLFGR